MIVIKEINLVTILEHVDDTMIIKINENVWQTRLDKSIKKIKIGDSFLALLEKNADSILIKPINKNVLDYKANLNIIS